MNITESEVSDVDEDDAFDETLLDRVYALKDIVPPTYRKRIASAADTGYSWLSSGLSLSGKTLWVVSTSALLLGVPWALAFSEEQQYQEMEREMRMQQSANEVCHDGMECVILGALLTVICSFLPLVARLALSRRCRWTICIRLWDDFCAMDYGCSDCTIFSALELPLSAAGAITRWTTWASTDTNDCPGS
jgi:import receptor subunit TOM22